MTTQNRAAGYYWVKRKAYASVKDPAFEVGKYDGHKYWRVPSHARGLIRDEAKFSFISCEPITLPQPDLPPIPPLTAYLIH